MINHDTSLEKYSSKSTVRLFKTVVGKTGNIYYPNVYGPSNPLPEKFMTAQYVELISGEVEQDERLEKEIPTPNQTVVSKSPGLLEEINLNKNESKVQEVVIENTAQSSFEPTQVKATKKELNINQATKAEIVALQGVGAKTVDKVIELRELFPFADYKDLNDRVALTFGRKWDEFNLIFE
jgi:DNA uptake protein ComE-like DNA-binding protein